MNNYDEGPHPLYLLGVLIFIATAWALFYVFKDTVERILPIIFWWVIIPLAVIGFFTWPIMIGMIEAEQNFNRRIDWGAVKTRYIYFAIFLAVGTFIAFILGM